MNTETYSISVLCITDGKQKKEPIAKGIAELYLNLIAEAVYKDLVLGYANQFDGVALLIEREKQND